MLLPKEAINELHPFDFRGHSYRVTALGAAKPHWLLESFLMERDIRDRWWDPKEGELVIDVGAAYGSYTLTALAKGASVIAFEPDKDHFFSLYTNLIVNGFLDNCLLFNGLLGEAEGTDLFYPESHSDRPEGKSEVRMVFTLDALLAGLQPKFVNWIKIDVEGAELGVLRGAIGTLKQYRPKLLVENHCGFMPGIDEQIREFLKPLDYSEENVADPERPNNNWSLWTP